MLRKLLSLSALMASVAALSACGNADANKTSGQIAVKVNGDEISVHQINEAIARSNDIPPEQAKRAAAQVLERLIDQELLVQRALEAKLDRDPQVMRAIEGAKRQILAQAYVERAATAAPTQGEDEIGKFYKQNPALFERRRIYRVHELAVVAPQQKLGALKAAAAAAKSLNDLAGWFKSQQLPFNVATATRPAEQVASDLLPRMLEMKEGQIAVLTTSRGTTVVQLLRAEEAPVSEPQAAPIIKQFLANLKRLEIAQAEIRKLRERAKIEYVGEFAAAGPAAAAQPAPSEATPKASGEDDEHIKRGLSGLR